MSLDDSDAPGFTLESTNGGETTLSETLEDGPIVVLVNCGHWYDILLVVHGEVSSRWGYRLPTHGGNLRVRMLLVGTERA
ncbi:peroxiredoxin [Halogeometricum pallidum JCM 14848]|uniref:Peroxiredoxin n=1 Tax=Halogeometricum pallidum JCM 14848 TaxID=1227487 RepID=M0D349_HALPD|nr:peroxiredoxin [Halogeometricum pallidum]ELZ29951.1 peroxiredoxin [Halogeometricum pallidum JCM 14848]